MCSQEDSRQLIWFKDTTSLLSLDLNKENKLQVFKSKGKVFQRLADLINYD